MIGGRQKKKEVLRSRERMSRWHPRLKYKPLGMISSGAIYLQTASPHKSFRNSGSFVWPRDTGVDLYLEL